MQRKATKQSPGPDAEERRFIRWVKERCICAACGAEGPVIAHHVHGSTYKRKIDLVTVQLGHWFILGLCQRCDDVVTHGSRRAFRDRFGPESELWRRQAEDYPGVIPDIVWRGICET